jgi:dimethylglycine dehydrogenase
LKVPENYSRRFRLAYPNEELPAARPVRRSPIYERLIAAGAVMGANFGLEHALWFAPEGMARTETPTYRRSEAFPVVRAECLAVRSAVGIYETTNYGKYEITGRGARGWLDRVFASRIPRPGRLALAPMLNSAGRIVGDLSIACLAEDRFLIIGSGFAEEFHLRWFSLSDVPADVFVRSAASTLAGVSIAGPHARELVQRLTRTDLSAGAFRLFQVAETAVGLTPAILTRAGFTGELGYEIWTTPDYFATFYEELLAAGADLGLVHFGGRALSSLRLEKAYGSFNKDFRPDYTPGETGLDRYIDFGKPDFTGRAAALAERTAGVRRRFVVMEVVDTDVEVVGFESILKEGVAVGYVTSGAYGHCIDKSLAAGYIPAALVKEGARFEIDILGEIRTATVRLQPLYDPESVRLRA